MSNERSSLSRALCPETVAVIGASDRLRSRGSYVWRAVSRSALLKNAWAINPKYKYIGERPCFSKIGEVPGDIDLAVISLRADRILRTLIEVGERGAGAVLITPDENAYSSDRLWLEKLRIIADQYRLRLIGPDSIGLMNPGIGVNASYWPNLPKPGNIALMAQSGMIATALLDYAQEAELGFSGVIATGAGIDIDLPELIDYYSRDKNTRVIAVHVEGIRQPRAFFSALRAASAVKQVVVLKAGSSAGFAADRIASFKLGTDAGRDSAFEALVRQAGAILVPTFEEFTAAIAAFATSRIPRGNRLAVIANGSGFAALTASAAQSRGIDLHGLSNSTIKLLQDAYPSQQIAVNPVNVGVTAPAERYRKTLQIVLQDPMIDGALVVVGPGPVSTIDPTLRYLAKTAAGSFKPVITAWVSDRTTRSVRKQLRSVPNAPITAIQSPVAAAYAFGYLAEHAKQREWRLRTPSDAQVDISRDALSEARTIIRNALDTGRHALSTADAARFLGLFGLPSVPMKFVRTPEAALEAAESLGWPVALKVQAEGLGHKSDAGGVVLDIGDADSLTAAWTRMMQTVGRRSPFTPIEGAVVQKMMPHAFVRELRLAVSHDNVLGPVIEFGAGGLGADIYQDTVAALPPFGLNTAGDLVNAARISRALGNYRGLDAADRTVLARALSRLSILCALIPAVRDITVNPLVWTETGPRALDASVNLCDRPQEPDLLFSHLTICPPPLEDISVVPVKGGELTLRPLLESDFELLRAFMKRLSDKSVYLRFHASVQISDERITELCTFDRARESAWVLSDAEGIHGVSRWHLTDIPDEAEFGIVVEDAWQRRGLAGHLMKKIELTAKERGIRRFIGHVLKGNEAMHGMMTAFGYRKEETDARDTDPWSKFLSDDGNDV